MLENPQPRSARLSTGLSMLATRMANRRQAVVTAYFRTGSRFESEAENGISHFLEHMLFRGTPSFPNSRLLAEAFEDLGGTLEASTAADHGNLAIAIPRENLGSVLRLMSEVFQAPLLRDVEVEKAIIREEILEDFDDAGRLIDGASVIRRLAFGRGGLGQLITGPVDNLERFSHEQLRAHHRRTHIANHLVISVAGDVDEEQCLTELERSFGAVLPGRPLEMISPEPQRQARFELVPHSGSSQTALHIGYRCPGLNSELEPSLELLLRLIDDGMSTRLYQRLCDKSGLCYDASASYEAYDDVGLIEFEADTAHTTSDAVAREVLNLTSELSAQKVSSAELDRIRRRVRWQYEALFDDPAEVADVLALSCLQGTAWPEERLERLLDVTADDVLGAAQRVFRPQGRNVVVIGAPPAERAQRLEDLALAT